MGQSRAIAKRIQRADSSVPLRLAQAAKTSRRTGRIVLVTVYRLLMTSGGTETHEGAGLDKDAATSRPRPAAADAVAHVGKVILAEVGQVIIIQASDAESDAQKRG